MAFETKHFLDVLFDAGDHICVSRDAFGVELVPVAELDLSNISERQYVAINPFVAGTTRKDENVAEFRNILFEFDTGTLEEQVKLVYDLELPFTTLVYSGGKSIHAVLSLASPCTDADVYRDLVLNLYAAVKVSDPRCKNPSRFTRLGGATRDSGVEQTILDCRSSRTTEAELQRFCAKHIFSIIEARKKREPEGVLEAGARGELSVRTKDLLRIGAKPGQSRRQEIFYAAHDYKNQGYGLDETQAALSAAAIRMGLSDRREIFDLIARGWKRAQFRPRILK